MKKMPKVVDRWFAYDFECRLAGVEGLYLELDLPGLDELVLGEVDAGEPVAIGGAR